VAGRLASTQRLRARCAPDPGRKPADELRKPLLSLSPARRHPASPMSGQRVAGEVSTFG
jgi:hypothetical protein